MRVLYVHPGLVPPAKDLKMNQMFWVPAPVCGDVLLPTWARTADEIRQNLGDDSWPEYRVNNFTYHLYLAGRYNYGDLRQKLVIFLFYIRHGLRLHRRHPFDCIVSYNWTLTGFSALILKWLTGAKLIIELATNPQDAYRFNRFGETYAGPSNDWKTRLMRHVSRMFLNFVGGSADRIGMLYPNQLSQFPRLQKVPAFVMAPFVPISRVQFTGFSEDTVLLVGAPWYVKGVDILIAAFRQIESDFPHVRLRLLGHYPDRRDLEKMIGGSRQIEIITAVPQPEALKIIASAGIFVLASRTEGAARVLFEAMAAGKPIIASRVGGTEHYIKEGVNGLLFDSGNVDELAGKLRLMLTSPELRKRLGEKGHELATTQHDEVTFGRDFAEMVKLTVGKSAGSCAPAELEVTASDSQR